MNRRMCTDEEIGDDPLPLATTLEKTEEHLPGKHRAFLIRRHEVDLPVGEELVDTIPVAKRGENLRKNGLAHDQLSLQQCLAKSPFGFLRMCRVGQEHVEHD